MKAKLCVDASVVIKWLIKEIDTDPALDLLEKIKATQTVCYAPSLIDYEVGSTLRLKLRRGHLTSKEMYTALEFYRNLPLLMLHVTDLCYKSIPVAEALDQSTIYDIGYLLVAQQQGADLITADRRFFESAHSIYPFVQDFRVYLTNLSDPPKSSHPAPRA